MSVNGEPRITQRSAVRYTVNNAKASSAPPFETITASGEGVPQLCPKALWPSKLQLTTQLAVCVALHHLSGQYLVFIGNEHTSNHSIYNARDVSVPDCVSKHDVLGTASHGKTIRCIINRATKCNLQRGYNAPQIILVFMRANSAVVLNLHNILATHKHLIGA